MKKSEIYRAAVEAVIDAQMPLETKMAVLEELIRRESMERYFEEQETGK